MRAGLLGAFRRCNRGNVAILFALSALPLFGVAGMAVDYARAVDGRTQLQTALDGAVLAGAVAAGKEVSTAQSFFDAAVAPYGLDGAVASFKLDSGTLSGNAQAEVPSTLLKVMHVDTVEIGVNAAAKVTATQSPVCILVLDPSATDALKANSGVKIRAPDCEIHVRSAASQAAMFNSGNSFDVQRICIKGGQRTNGSTIAAVQAPCDPIADPFAGKLPEVSVPSCSLNPQPYNANGADVTVPQGNYCSLQLNSPRNLYLQPGLFQNVSLNGTPTIYLAPGLYIIKGRINVNSGTVFKGTGVTFYFPDTSSELHFNGNVSWDVSAPTSGTYKDILFMEPNGGSSKPQWTFDTTVGSKASGLIYLPNRNLTINSSSVVSFDSASIVSNQLLLNAQTDWTFNNVSDRMSAAGTGGGAIALTR